MKKMIPAVIAVAALLGAGGCATSGVSESGSLSDRACTAIADQHFDKAEKLLTEALEKNPQNAYAWLNMGVVHHHKKQYEQARKCYLNVVQYAWDEKGSNKDAEGKSLITMAREKLERLPPPAIQPKQ